LGDGHSTAASLAERVGLSTSRICRIIASLERKGLIERFRDNHDRRQWENVLTNQGKQKLLMMQEKGIEMPQWLLSLASSKDLLPFH
jgi:DNA-binding MarR family transcriptional regulator